MSELLTKLGIDWHLFLAQVVNFGILAFLLHRFLYKPMLKILSERSTAAKEVVEGAASMAQAKRDLEQEIAESRNKARKEADEILVEVRKKSEVVRADATAQLEKELVSMKNKALAEIEKERAKAMNEAKNELASTVILAAEKVLEREVKNQDSLKLAQEALSKVKE